MSNFTLKRVHKCGAICEEGMDRCPGCGKPMLVLPPEMVELAKTTERVCGLDKLRISLLAIITHAYMAGWEARDVADEPAVIQAERSVA